MKCGKDQAITTAKQEENIERISDVAVRELPDSDHFPFESCREELFETIMSN
jgi:hypothetical protein